MEAFDEEHLKHLDVISTSLFTERGLVKLLDTIVALLKKAQRFELVGFAYDIARPILVRDKQYARLAETSAEEAECYNQILSLNKCGVEFTNLPLCPLR